RGPFCPRTPGTAAAPTAPDCCRHERRRRRPRTPDIPAARVAPDCLSATRRPLLLPYLLEIDRRDQRCVVFLFPFFFTQQRREFDDVTMRDVGGELGRHQIGHAFA